jgi:hypothetical protein
MASGLLYGKPGTTYMDQVYVVVVKEASANGDGPSWLSSGGSLAMAPIEFGADPLARRKYRVAAWRAVQRNSKRCLMRDKVLGLVAMLGISVAGWASVAVLISHFVR